MKKLQEIQIQNIKNSLQNCTAEINATQLLLKDAKTLQYNEITSMYVCGLTEKIKILINERAKLNADLLFLTTDIEKIGQDLDNSLKKLNYSATQRIYGVFSLSFYDLATKTIEDLIYMSIKFIDKMEGGKK